MTHQIRQAWIFKSCRANERETMSTYKLYYFNARGGAEPIRIIFAQAGVKYEDVRFEREQWVQEYKPSKMRLLNWFI